MDQPALTAGPKKTAYKNQAKKLLENTFPLISCAAINAVLKSVDFSFADAFYILREIDETTRGKGDGAHEKAIRHLQHHPNNKIKVFLKHPRAKKRFSVREPLLLEEVACIDELNVKERDPPAPAPNDDEDGEKENENEGALVECGCCYGDYPAKDMKQCVANVGHIVCKTCISRYVSEQLDGNNCIQFQCIVDDSCGQIYPTTTVLDEILSPRLKRRTNDAIFRAQVEQAGVEGVWTCPKCAYIGYLDRAYATVACPECNVVYCTGCQQVAHGKKSCEEVRAEKEGLNNLIHLAHERMSQATIRRCPSCQTPFTKHDGCNKITCKTPGCGTKSCYLCGVQIAGYDHFCNHQRAAKNPCPCGKKCELWTNTEVMARRDRKLRHEAGQKVLQEAGFAPDRIKQILASPSDKKKAPRKKAAPMAPLDELANNQAPAHPAPAEPVAPPAPQAGEPVNGGANEPGDPRECIIL